jgi:hypothetical protein
MPRYILRLGFGGFLFVWFFVGCITLGFKLRASRLQRVPYCLRLTCSSFCSGYFGEGLSQTILPGWSQTSILLISPSQVAKTTYVSHRHLDFFSFKFHFLSALPFTPLNQYRWQATLYTFTASTQKPEVWFPAWIKGGDGLLEWLQW